MESNKLLAIVIPTYNRADFLDYNLKNHIPILKEHNIQIFISDNASTDNTENIVKKWMKEYDFLFYSKNEINIGPDANFEKALKMPNTDYVWLLGDTSFFNKIEFNLLLNRIDDNSFDMIVTNSENRVKGIETTVFTNHNELLTTLGWHMTQISSLIFSKELLSKANFSRYYNSNFIQTGIIFEYLSLKSYIEVLWNNDVSVNLIKLGNIKKESWQNQTFPIWLKNWPNFIFSLPPIYTLESKELTIKKHNCLTRIFSLKYLLYLRSYNFYTLNEYLVYNKFLKYSGRKYPKITFLLPLLVPSCLMKIIRKYFFKGK
jgi:glycosyltransferase involved in cell wall biosynthesis